jgi:APA family basic amino acid/polyamine antiporter
VNAPFSVVGTHTLVPTGALINLPAVFLIAVMTTLLVIGIRESARFNNIIVFVKVAIVFLVIGFGFQFVNPANWHPFVPPNQGEFGAFGWSGVLRAAGVIFFAYIGFDAVSTAAQEAKNPQRDMPIGILGSLAVCTVLYILMALVMTGLAHYSELNVPHPVSVAIAKAGPGLAWLELLVNIGAVAGLASVVLVMLLGQPRIFFAMSRDGLLPAAFGKVHPKFQTPYIPTIITGTIAGIVAGLFPIGLLGELVSIGTLLAFAIVCGGILVLRITRPEIPRPFRVPVFWFVAPAGVLSCLYLMSGLPIDTWLRLLIWMALGLVIYFLYGRSHSRAAAAERAG